jgi:UDP:flavonoid glycosyltransferase YjiC (YdhE family)
MHQIIIAATPIYGHVAPLRSIAADLVDRGCDVTFLTGSTFEDFIRSTGARFVPLAGAADFDGSDAACFPQRAEVPPGPLLIDFDLRHLFIDPIPAQHHALQELLRAAESKAPGEPVHVVHDTVFMGLWPVLLGAAGIRPTGAIGIGVTPLPLRSIDTAPFGLGLAPDASPAGRTRNAALNTMVADQLFVSAQTHLQQTLLGLGVTGPVPFVFDAMVAVPDRFLQLAIPAIEYLRSDAPTNLRYIGALPGISLRAPSSLPEWWGELAGKRPVVAVTQGTVANRDFEELILPTLQALAEEDMMVVAVTGRADADLGALPDNARVADYIPFDVLLPHVDVLVSNGGYGGIQQALCHGIPLVLAGESEDKIEVTARMAHTGAAINLRTGRPTKPSLHAAVLSVLNEPTFRMNARRLQAEYATCNAFDAIADTIHELSAEAAGQSLERALA